VVTETVCIGVPAIRYSFVHNNSLYCFVVSVEVFYVKCILDLIVFLLKNTSIL